MSKGDIQKAKDEACVRCGYGPSKHRLANFADGRQIGSAFLVCPSAIYKTAKDVRDELSSSEDHR